MSNVESVVWFHQCCILPVFFLLPWFGWRKTKHAPFWFSYQELKSSNLQFCTVLEHTPLNLGFCTYNKSIYTDQEMYFMKIICLLAKLTKSWIHTHFFFYIACSSLHMKPSLKLLYQVSCEWPWSSDHNKIKIMWQKCFSFLFLSQFMNKKETNCCVALH